MAREGIKTLIVSFLLIALVFFCLLSFGGQFAYDNNTNNSILSNPVINSSFADLGGNITETEATAATQREVFEQEQMQTGFGALLLLSIKSLVQIFTGSLVNFFNLFKTLISAVLGVNNTIATVVLGTLGSILLISMILLGWRAIKAGE